MRALSRECRLNSKSSRSLLFDCKNHRTNICFHSKKWWRRAKRSNIYWIQLLMGSGTVTPMWRKSKQFFRSMAQRSILNDRMNLIFCSNIKKCCTGNSTVDDLTMDALAVTNAFRLHTITFRIFLPEEKRPEPKNAFAQMMASATQKSVSSF